MLQKIHQTQIDYDKEVQRVDNAIIALGKELEDLVYKRYELIAQKHDLDTHDLIDCIADNELMPKEVTELIISAMGKPHAE